MTSTCIIGISGYSGVGKTTLIKTILPELKKQGFAVGVLKHIHHKLNIDIRGKDTDHFFRAGADCVFAHDVQQGFVRYRNNDKSFPDLIKRFPVGLDLILVEGYKDAGIPGIRLETGAVGEKTHAGHRNKKAIYRDDPQYHRKALAYIREELEKVHSTRPLMAGLMINDKSARIGVTETLLSLKWKTSAEMSFNTLSAVFGKIVLLGTGPLLRRLNAVDRLPGVCGLKSPVSFMLSAFRWSPGSAWIISSVDMIHMHKEAYAWLLGQRKPGIWGVLPKIKGSKEIEITGAVYEPMIFEHIESLAGQEAPTLQEISRHPKVIIPVIPESLTSAWRKEKALGE